MPCEVQVQALAERLHDVGGVSVARLPDDAVLLLAEIIERWAALWIVDESVFGAGGKTSWLLVDELRIEPR